jgi:tRNA threonylcarbamoyl adenosine modification protein YeaZ/ribosomal-protein-alanine acetyltransferase
MKILSLDTAMAACSVAVVDTDESLPLAAAFVAMERGHAEALAPMAADVLQAAGVTLSAIDRVAVTIGPGTFTGVRIGLSFAKGLALARGLPVIGIDSLSAIAANEHGDAPLLVVADARNGEVYAASFDAARQLVSGPRVTTAAGAVADMPEGSLVIGTAAQAVVAATGRTDLRLSFAGALPVAANFAHRAAAVHPGASPAPLYLRAPDAKPQASARQRAPSFSFETATLMAAPLLASLHAEAFAEGWSAPALEDLLNMPGAAAVVASDGEAPAGFILTRRAADEAEIITIATRPAMRRRGVARQLLARQISQLASEGVRQLFLEVAPSNTAALRLYASAGFREAGRRKGYYRSGDGVEDAIVMRRELAP